MRIKDMIGMKLSEALPEINKDIKIGTVNGGAYFYCGHSDGLAKEILTWNSSSKFDREERLLNMAEKIEKAIDSFPTISDYIRYELKKQNKMSIGDLGGYIAYMDQKLKALQMRVDKYERLKNAEYVPLEERIIVDVVYSIDEYDAINILIEGDEPGQYWTIKEYKEGIHKEDLEDYE